MLLILFFWGLGGHIRAVWVWFIVCYLIGPYEVQGSLSSFVALLVTYNY